MAIAVAAVACKPEEAATPSVSVVSTEDTLVIPTEGGEAVITFEANVEWTATLDATSAEWATITPANGAAGQATVKVIALENETNDNRVATVTINAQSAKAEVKVTQLQKDALVLDGEKAFTVPAEGGEVKFAVNANVTLTATPDVDWITATKAMTKTEFTFAVAANEGVAREGKIEVTDGTIKETITVSQDAWAPVFEVSNEAEYWVALEGGSVSFTVNSNVEYGVTVAEGGEWLTVANEGDTYTLTAGAYDGFNYRSVLVTVAPADEAYAESGVSFYVFQNGRAAKLWTLNPTLDLEGYDASKKVRLAAYGDYILVANTTKAYALNPADGSVVTTFNFPEGVEAGSLCVDDAGNIVVATDCAYGGTMGIYSIADPANPQPELIKDWNTGNYYGTNVGNLRIKGNIKENALMTALVGTGAGGAVMMWEFEAGVCSTWYGVNPPYEVSGCEFGCAVPLGTKFEDGLLHVGYGGDYNVKYLANPVLDNYTDNAWVTSYVTGYSWMENTNCITTAEYNGKKYAAYTAGCHFNYDSADAILLDITDPAAAQHVYTYNGDLDVARDEAFANLNWTGLGTYSDILLVPTADALLMVYVDGNFNGMSCIAIK